MGHQVNFFVLPDDLPVIETAIRSAGDVCFLEDRTPTGRPVILGTLAVDPDEKSRQQLRAHFASDLRFRPELPDPDFVKWGDRVLSRIKKTLQRAPELPPWIYVSAAALQWIRDNHAVTDGGATSVRKPPTAAAP